MIFARTTLALLLVSLAGCVEYPLSPLGETLFVTAVETSEKLQSNNVDILWIVDNSGSMREEQEELGQRFDEFIGALAALEVDFHMGVISTDANDRGKLRMQPGNSLAAGCSAPLPSLNYCADRYRQWQSDAQERGISMPRFLSAGDYYIDPTLPSAGFHQQDLADDFRCLASTGDCGSAFEMGLDGVRSALSREVLASANEGFIRDDAFLLVIFLTDEDDCSNDGALQLTQDADCYARERRHLLTPVPEFYDFLVDLKGGAEDKVLIAGIIGPTDGQEPQTFHELTSGSILWSCTSALGGTVGASASARDGRRYRELIRLAGGRGVEESICQGSFSRALANIAEIVRAALNVNCLDKEPRSCIDDSDCGGDLRCINPGDPNLGHRYCENFEISVEIERSPGSEFETLVSPGTAGSTQTEGAEFLVDYDTQVCQYGIAFNFAPRSRPPTGARYRVSYPRSTELLSATGGEEQ